MTMPTKKGTVVEGGYISTKYYREMYMPSL